MIGPTPGTLISRRQTSSLANDGEHLLRQAGELLSHRGEDGKQRLDETDDEGIIAGQFGAHARQRRRDRAGRA